jgi:alkaline phosphatase D
MVWSRVDRPARMIVEYATSESFDDARTVVGPAALEDTDFTAKVDLTGLPPGQTIVYRVRFLDLADLKTLSEPVSGSFRTAAQRPRHVRFVWSGDCCGQGWGINPAWGGLRCFETIRRNRPDFFLHSGDIVYADGPLQAERLLPDGTIWRNIVTEEKAKVAETLAEFRGQYKYNLLDDNLRRLLAEVPIVAQWDDHEAINNWYPGEIIDDPRYQVKSASLLAARGNRAFHEYLPLRPTPGDGERIYRRIAYGPLLDVFILDMRSYRAANGPNREEKPGPETALLGAEQLAWLKQQLAESRAVWKVIAADQPIGIVVRDGASAFEAIANGDGPAQGREHEIADLLSFLKRRRIRNTVWLTADVHYTAAHSYDPERARFRDFDAFWEFVSGPLHAGTGRAGPMDDTFGPAVVFQKGGDTDGPLGPAAGLQFFGVVDIDGESGVMTVTLKDLEDAPLFQVDLQPAR